MSVDQIAPTARALGIVACVLLGSGCVSMQQAAQGGDAEAVAKGLASGKDVNAVDARGRTLLALAAEKGQLAVMRELLSRGADLERPDAQGMRPLFIAAGTNQLPAVQELAVAGAQIDSRNTSQEMTPLMPAAESGYKAIVEYLLSRGASPLAQSTDGQTALSRLAWVDARSSQSDGPGTAAALLAAVKARTDKRGHGAYLNQQDADGYTALHRAVARNNAELVTLLAGQGANVNLAANVAVGDERAALQPAAPLVTPSARATGGALSGLLPGLQRIPGLGGLLQGDAPLETPAKLGPVDVERGSWAPLHTVALHCEGGEAGMKALLSAGADPVARTGRKQTTLHVLAACTGNDPAATAAPLLAVLGKRTKAAQRSYLNERDPVTGEAPALLTAVARGHETLVGQLLRAGADVNLTNAAGRSPLHQAAADARLPLVEKLLSQRANARTKDGEGNTALHLALRQGNAEIAQRLLVAGADANLPDSSGVPPLHAMAERGNAELVTLLLKNRADPNQMHNGSTPLYLAVQKNDLAVARALLDGRADPNRAATSTQSAPLHLAASAGNTAAFELLVARGANRSLRDAQNRTADEIAQARAERLAREAAEAERQRQIAAAKEQENSFQWGKFAALAAGAAAGGLTELDSGTQAQMLMGMVQDSMAGQNSISNTQAAAQAASGSAGSMGTSGYGGSGRGPSGGPQNWTPDPPSSGLGTACRGYNVDNYKEYFAANQNGPDVQLHTLCAAAFNYYWMYRNARTQGYTKEEARVTYNAHLDAARVAENFYANTRTN